MRQPPPVSTLRRSHEDQMDSQQASLSGSIRARPSAAPIAGGGRAGGEWRSCGVPFDTSERACELCVQPDFYARRRGSPKRCAVWRYRHAYGLPQR